MARMAANRQKKVLRLFGVSFSDTISAGAAGWEIGRIFSNPDNRDRWSKYVYLTNDSDDSSAELKPFEKTALDNCTLPSGWSVSHLMRIAREEIAAQIVENESPYDSPQPSVVFEGRTFVFTGKFEFGPRKKCEQATLDIGGLITIDDSVSLSIDYLVVGSKGSQHWSHGSYGRKIETAVLLRRNHGKPAIISESNWQLACQANTVVLPLHRDELSSEHKNT
jgi:hypothetical protein